MTETLLDKIEESLRQALTYNENAEVPPVVLLWPDRERQFGCVATKLRSRVPLLTLGDLQIDIAQGPAYWIRCVIAGTVDLELREDIHVVYMPGVGREDLRAIENCPRELAPIAELQYRGQWFTHPNGKDWTIRGFLMNRDRGVGLQVAEDNATAEALLDALDELLFQPIRRLTAQFIDAEFLHRLLNPDPTAQMLEWLDDPKGFKSRLDPAQWNAFIGLCKSEFDFDPSVEGEVSGGKYLGLRQGAWARVWRRFEEEPARYSVVEDRLRKGKPFELFLDHPDSWPQVNEEAEVNLQSELAKLEGVPAGEAREAIESLWEEHRERHNWVWAKLDQAPLAFALEQLHRLALLTTSGPSGDVNDLVSAYADRGWQADDAFLAAIGAVIELTGRKDVAEAAKALYRPWLESHTRDLQTVIGPMVNAGTYNTGPEVSSENGTVTVFVDGLRFDLGQRLVDRLGGFDVKVDQVLAALPTVTETTKPVLTPVPEDSLNPGNDLGTVRANSGAKVDLRVLHNLMIERGLQILQGAEIGDPTGSAWTEVGDLDRRGHEFGMAIVDEIDRELDAIARRVKLLLDAGWKQVDIVTDHGWILMPGGLEKVELPAATAELKKGRCARLKEGAQVSVPTIPWHWDKNVRIGLAPGIGCFVANQEYEHGGVSLQECVVPRLSVRVGDVSTKTGGAAITKLKWLGLLCRVEFENIAPGATVDIRALPADSKTSVVETVKETAGEGKQSLHVTDEELEGEKAYVVIIGQDGSILAQREVIIGVNR